MGAMKIKPECISPCVRHCCLDEEDICLGCFRSLDEILKWHDASDEQKNEILIKASTRKAAFRGARLNR